MRVLDRQTLMTQNDSGARRDSWRSRNESVIWENRAGLTEKEGPGFRALRIACQICWFGWLPSLGMKTLEETHFPDLTGFLVTAVRLLFY